MQEYRRLGFTSDFQYSYYVQVVCPVCGAANYVDMSYADTFLVIGKIHEFTCNEAGGNKHRFTVFATIGGQVIVYAGEMNYGE